MNLSQVVSRGKGRVAAAVGVFLLALAGCGGGQVDEFRPQRLLAFGDETSVIESDGRKYSVNALTESDDDAADTIDCNNNPLWIQWVADGYNFVFPQCNPSDVAGPQGKILATVGAKADDIKTQVDQFLDTGAFTESDLATMMVGHNDVLELYAEYPGRSEADITAELEARGVRLAAQVNRVAQAGPAVIVSTIFDPSLTPFAHQQTGTGRALLKRLGAAYNTAVILNIINDGRIIGLVFGDVLSQSIVDNAGGYGFSNVVDGACATALPDCSTDDFVDEDAGSFTWLWADDTRPGPGFHQRLGSLVLSRARNNPF
jgi:phospholipase/lecithinase/hemolysin